MVGSGKTIQIRAASRKITESPKVKRANIRTSMRIEVEGNNGIMCCY